MGDHGSTHEVCHFLLIKIIDSPEDYAKLCIQEIVWLHGSLLSIIAYCGAQFGANFRKSIRKWFGTQVNLNTTFHLQTNEHVEHIIHTLKDTLRACALDIKGNWDDHLPLIELAYYNSYHSNIRMALFEA